MPMKVGITGGIGSGKSTVCRIFSRLGVPIFNSDDEAKNLMNHAPELKEKISAHFGREAYLENGLLNRSYLARQVFLNPVNHTLIGQWVHPLVIQQFIAWSERQATPYVLKESALLLETEQRDLLLDEVMLVTAPMELRIRRVLARDPHRNQQDVEQIIQQQTDDALKRKRADYVLENDETEPLIPRIVSIHQTLLLHAKKIPS